MVIHDEGKFDPRSIPLKSWNEYEWVVFLLVRPGHRLTM